MSVRDGYQPGVPCWVDTLQADPRAALRFYGELFGWEFDGPGRMPGTPPGEYFVARRRGRDVAGVGTQTAADAPAAAAWNTYVEVESATDAAGRVRDAGGEILMEPCAAPPAGRTAVVADPQGAAFCLWEPRERRGAQLVNEPGAWSMSYLNTRDPEAAKGFYAAVFGWDADAFEAGGGEIALYRLPGFVGGEPQQPVPRDVVATMIPMSPDRVPEDVPAHWSIDFWVGDVDATVGTAARLGGTIVASPYDVPGVPMRQAVVADPEGATFSVTELSGV